MKRLFLIFISLFLTLMLFAGGKVSQKGNSFILSGNNYSIELDSTSGAIKKIASNGKNSGITTLNGLWTARFRDNSIQSANSSVCQSSFSTRKLILNFKNSQIDVDVVITPRAQFCDFQATLNVHSGELKDFELPSKFTFAPKDVKEITFHSSSPRNIGLSVSSQFFVDKTNDESFKRYENGDVKGQSLYKQILGEECACIEASVSKQIAGKDIDNWLPKYAKDRALDYEFAPTRPFSKIADIDLLRTPDGKRTSVGGSRLGGKGALFRFGAWVEDNFKDYYTMLGIVENVITKALIEAKTQKSPRKKIGIIELEGVKSMKSWASRKHYKRYTFETLDSPEKIDKALRDPNYLFILNTCCEIIPNLNGEAPEATAKKIADFVRAGGYWFETSGLSFFRGVKRKSFLNIESTVPATTADFFHLDMNGCKIAYFSVQDIMDSTFENPKNSFTTSRFEIGGDVNGGYLTRPFTRYIKGGEPKWQSPKVRLLFGKDLQRSADAFCKANKVVKKYSEKLSPELAKKFSDSVMIFLPHKSLKEIQDLMKYVPKNNLIHVSRYLWGGFDKQYPDHYPPNPSFSTPEEYKKYIADVRADGHLYMPYTNNTWWCDNPRSKTFLECGEAPLSLRVNGKVYKENYYGSDGFISCMWHPDVRKANKKMVVDSVDEYGCDILFQDQTGARPSVLDFNKASPNPNRYSDSFIYQAREDSKKIPLSTEDGWWGIANEEIQFCGLTFGIMDGFYVAWSPSIWKTFPKNSIRMNNVIGAFYHDKLSLSHHDLAFGLVTQRDISKTLGIGFTTMINMHGKMTNPYYTQYIYWLDRLQKSIVSKYIGAKMRKFEHNWKDTKTSDSFGYINAQYGDVKIFASIDDCPKQIGDVELAPDGFIAESKGVKAGCVNSIKGIRASVPCSYVVEETEKSVKVWIFAQTQSSLIIPVKAKVKALKLPNNTPLNFTQKDGVVQFDMPLGKSGNKNNFLFTEILVEL